VAAPSEAPSRAVCRASPACDPPQQIPGSRASPRPASVVCALAGQSPCSCFCLCGSCVLLVLSFALRSLRVALESCVPPLSLQSTFVFNISK
jgi:hypothetical protein